MQPDLFLRSLARTWDGVRALTGGAVEGIGGEAINCSPAAWWDTGASSDGSDVEVSVTEEAAV